jgi:hypothetical protein
MSIIRHHIEWLSLLEVSGPFLSLPVLQRVFPQGLETVGGDAAGEFRAALEEWEEESSDAETHDAWLRYVLGTVLEYPQECITDDRAECEAWRFTEPGHGIVLQPDIVLTAGEEEAKPLLFVTAYPPVQDLEKPVKGSPSIASPAARMRELLQVNQVPVGLVTNGERWMLVYAPQGESTSYVSWYASLMAEETLTLRAFRALLGVRRFFGVAEDETLEALYRQSAEQQRDVTDQLGMQVRSAVEIFVRTLDRIDTESKHGLLAGESEAAIYEAAVTVMMRLVFVLSAEERGLLLLGHPVYDRHYAASTLAAQLREAADRDGEEVLERRHDAWVRLLALFRALYAGLRHEDLLLPAYGGDLFDPDRFPFLEGRGRAMSWRSSASQPPAVDNRTVLHMLESLQYLEAPAVKGMPAERRRLSFRALDIEQIGHVYERLLDHTVLRAPAECPVLGLAGRKGCEPEITLDELDRIAGEWRPASDDAMPKPFLEWITEQTGKSEGALRKLCGEPVGERRESLLHTLCGDDEGILGRVRAWAPLLRDDSFGRPLLVPPGGAYVTQGSDRRETGTHYTPRALTEEVVRYTLEPLVYEGPADGAPRDKWKLRPARDILALRICDTAVGSAAFLVQACRYLAECLTEAWMRNAEDQPEGYPSDEGDRLVMAERMIAERCLYGVDRNPLAVQMSRLSLWLVTLSKDKPFTFLDHAIKCGDSLLGLAGMRQVETLHLAPPDVQQTGMWEKRFHDALGTAMEKRLQIESFSVAGIIDAERKRKLLAEADADMAMPKKAADILISAAVRTADGNALKRNGAPHRNVDTARERLLRILEDGSGLELEALHTESLTALEQGNPDSRQPRRPFHWPLEFPEIFNDGGFHAIVGNPPFLGGQRLTGPFGKGYRDYLVDIIAQGRKGSADLCAYFYLRIGSLLRLGGHAGLLATNTIAQGDTREVGLDAMEKDGFAIYRAVKSRKWPGEAALEIAQVWMKKGVWNGECVLDAQSSPAISPYLNIPGRTHGKPKRLKENLGKSFQGSIVLGKGFILTPDEAQHLLDKDPRNKDVLFPYLNGEDLNTRPDQSPSRWVINFHDWPLERAREYEDCFRIVEEEVFPERNKLRFGNPTARDRANRWWQFARPTKKLYSVISEMESVLVVPLVSKYLIVAIRPATYVYSHAVGIIVDGSYQMMAIVQSSLHEYWARIRGSSLETRMRYTPTDCFETFPMPDRANSLETIGIIYNSHRIQIMTHNSIGLTTTYNRLHCPGEHDARIRHLRDLQAEMDCAVLSAYGWDDLNLSHNFHKTDLGVRFTIGEAARREVLNRLMELNQARNA